jgi:cystathionine beta-lyase/cystathionine gamma-synthase
MDNLGSSKPLVPPLYQSSVYCLEDLDALDRIMSGDEPGFIYARDNHPNAVRLADRLATLERGSWAVLGSSGMASISAAVLALVSQGDRIVASHRLYGRTTQLFVQELTRFGVSATLVDTCDLDSVEKALRDDPPPKLLFVETLSNPLLRLADLPALVKLARARECLLMVDNTFATPVLCRPLELGAGLVMESLTKMVGGHSDVTLGVVCGANREDDLRLQVMQASSIWGLSSPPFDCWLAERSLDTLGLRMTAASRNAAALADWLSGQPGIVQVVYPGRSDHPDHAAAKALFATASGLLFGSMLCFELAGGREAVNRFLRLSPGVPFSPSLGDTTTTCSHPGATSHRYVSPAEKKRQGIGDGLIRLSVGIEDVERIKEEIAKGLPHAASQ